MRALGSFFFVIAILSLTQDGLGQRIQKKVKFRRVEANSKISNSSITSILQDSKGFLWVGTDDGLNRYDGYDFKVYRNVENDTTSLVKNKIQSIFEDSRGTLWISTLNSGLHRYNRALDVFNRVSEFSIQHCQVFRIIEDFDHNVWIGGILNAHAFVAMQDHKTGAWKKFLLFPTTDPVYSMLQNSEDEFWLGTRLNGLYKWNQRTNALEQFLHDPANVNSLPGDYIEKIKKDVNGNLWIATRTGLSKFDSQAKKYKNFVARPGETKTSIPTNAIMDICLDGKYLWIATENGGLSRMDIETESFTNFFYDKNDPTSIINNSIWSLHKDYQGRLWVGSYAKGLCVLDTNEEKFSVVNMHLENDLVNAILKDSKGRFWIGTEEGLLLIDKNTTHHFRHDPKNKNSLSSDAVNCLFEDSKHRIWSGHWGGGINRFNENSGTFVRYLPDPKVKGSLSNPNVFSIAESSKTGELLVCTFGGLHILKDEKAGIFEITPDYPHEGDQLLLTLLEDSKKNIWIGAYSGLGLYSMEDKKIKRFSITNNTTDASDRVNCIYEDRSGRLWIGSFAGLHQMISSTTFITYTTNDGLPVNMVQGILEDANGNLWLGTSHGLSVFNPETKTFKTYDESDGLISNEFRRKAFFRAEDGQLFVGGKGMNAFYPDSLTNNPNKPPVFITDLKIFNQSIKPNGEDGILKDAIAETKEIFLDYKHTFISLQYVGLNYTASYKNQYAYKLEGFDPDWNYVGSQRFATFTNLNPGTYTFRVKASNNDGLWNEEGASLIIHVLPPWWKTLWSQIIAIVLVAAITTTVYYMRIGSIERQNTKLEKLVNQRTRELQETNDELGLREKKIKAQNEELIQSQEETSAQRDLLADQNKKLEEASKIIERKNLEIILHNETLEEEVEKRTKELLEHNHQLEQFAFISAHNLRAPVARILGLGEIIKLTNDPQEKQMILDKLVFTTQELDTVVKDLTKILDIRKNNTSVITEISLKREMELVRATLQKEIDETGARIEEDFSTVTRIQSVKPYIDSILMNLVSNAIKYRHPERKPLITVTVEKVDPFICLCVRDNGLGINLSKYEDKLFKLYNRFHSHVEGKGMGLYLVKTQVAALGGRIEVVGNPDHGMTFKVFLPVKMTAFVTI